MTYSVGGEFWWIVVDVAQPDDGRGGIGKAVHGVALHIGGLDDQCVLRNFLEREAKQSGWELLLIRLIYVASTAESWQAAKKKPHKCSKISPK